MKKKSAYEKGFDDGWNKCAKLSVLVILFIGILLFASGLIKYIAL